MSGVAGEIGGLKCDASEGGGGDRQVQFRGTREGGVRFISDDL